MQKDMMNFHMFWYAWHLMYGENVSWLLSEEMQKFVEKNAVSYQQHNECKWEDI